MRACVKVCSMVDWHKEHSSRDQLSSGDLIVTRKRRVSPRSDLYFEVLSVPFKKKAVSSFFCTLGRRSRLESTRLVKSEVSLVRNLINTCQRMFFGCEGLPVGRTYQRSIFLRSYVKLSSVVTGSSIMSLQM
jgi:hypothetical protein